MTRLGAPTSLVDGVLPRPFRDLYVDAKRCMIAANVVPSALARS